MAQPSAQEIAQVRGEWVDGGWIVLRNDPDNSDHAAIYDWVIDFIENCRDDPEYSLIHNFIYHSLNFDIPFPATKRVRDELLHIVRMRIKDPGWRRLNA